MGDRDTAATRPARYAVPGAAERAKAPTLSREEALNDAASFGTIGLLAQGPATPIAAAWDPEAALRGVDSIAARGAMWESELGSQPGLGGLGLSGTGEGGGGRGAGIGLDQSGSLGHLLGAAGFGSGGDGHAFGGGHGRRGLTAQVRIRSHYAEGGYIERVAYARHFRAFFGRFRFCYENALAANPTLAGQIIVRMMIGHDGDVVAATDVGPGFPDASVVQCVLTVFRRMRLPTVEEPPPFVTYPIQFSPR
jgi:hypothetical protein